MKEGYLEVEDLQRYLGYDFYIDPKTGFATCKIQGPTLPEDVGDEGLWCFTPGKLMVLSDLDTCTCVRSPDGTVHRFSETRWQRFDPCSREGLRVGRVKEVRVVDGMVERKKELFPKLLILQPMSQDDFLEVNLSTGVVVPIRYRTGLKGERVGYRAEITCKGGGGIALYRLHGADMPEQLFLRNKAADGFSR